MSSNVKKLNEKISKKWKAEKYLEICDMSDELISVAQKELKKEKGDSFFAGKICSYLMASAVMMGHEETVKKISRIKETDVILNVFLEAEVGAWTIEALNILNLDYIRCNYIKKIIPEAYLSFFDVHKFDFDENEVESKEIQQAREVAEKREEGEWSAFLQRCEEVGVMDLASMVLDIPKDFFEGETRNDFYIAPLMKNAWAGNLEVLYKVDALCQELDIPYFVDWGTLLGTVRHHGFIPWDDDIDIGVLRKDYQKLKYAIENCQNELYVFDVYSEKDWGAHAFKIANDLNFIVNREKIKRYHGFSFTSSIDVFIIDGVPRDKKLENEQYDMLKAISEVAHNREEMESMDANTEEYAFMKKNERALIETIEKKCHIRFTSEDPSNQELFILKDEILGSYPEEACDYYTVPHRLANGQDYYIPKEVFDSRIRMPFEMIEVNVPVGYEFILKKNYGDNYMTPINRGGGHGYPFYDTLIEAMVEKRSKHTKEETLEYIKNISYGYYDRFLHQTNNRRLSFSENYFASETVDGVEVSEETKRNRAAELEVLEEIKRICKKKNLKYFAIGDTIIGAKKHAGYTPSSEGIHLGMLRDDYVTFMNCLGEELDSWFNYESIYLNDGHTDMRTYVTTDAFMVKDDDYLERFHGCSEIVGIDISPLDYVNENAATDQMQKELFTFMQKTASLTPLKPPYSEDILSLVDEWTEKLGVQVDREGNLQKEFLKMADNLMSSNREPSKYLRITPDLQVGLESVFDAELLKDTVEIPFENTMISVPVGYEKL